MSDLLPFIHPAWQFVGLILGFMALREGLALRKIRRVKVRHGSYAAGRMRHVRLGKCFVWIIASGYLLGIVEQSFVRGEPLFRSAHAYFATLGLALVGWGALYGYMMLRGTERYAERREIHGFLLPLALFLLVGVGILGLRLLP